MYDEQEEQKQVADGKWRNRIIGLVAVFTILGVWTWNFFRLSGLQNEGSISATLGDSFGALNTLFSGLAFAGVIYTILLQSTELGLQRRELRETKEALERSAEAQGEQVDNQLLSAKLQAINTLASESTDPNWKSLYTRLLDKTLIEIYGRNLETNTSVYVDELYSDVFNAYCDLIKDGYFEISHESKVSEFDEFAKSQLLLQTSNKYGVKSELLKNFVASLPHFDPHSGKEVLKSLNSHLQKHGLEMPQAIN